MPGGEEPGLLEHIVVEQPLELGEIRHAIEDVGGSTIGLGTARHHATLLAQAAELRQMRRTKRQPALVVVGRAGEADVDDHARTSLSALARPRPTVSHAARISSQVVASTSMPSRSRVSRASRSGSPGTSTGAFGSAAGEALTNSTNPSTSRPNQSAPAKRAGSIRIESMLLMIPPRRGLPGWMLGPPDSVVARS